MAIIFDYNGNNTAIKGKWDRNNVTITLGIEDNNRTHISDRICLANQESRFILIYNFSYKKV